MSASDFECGPGTPVWDAAGVCGTVVGGGPELVEIELSAGRRITAPRALLVADDDGHLRLDRALDGAHPGPAATTLPLAQETLRVGVARRETGRVRVDKRTEAREEAVDVPLLSESVEVERVPLGVTVDAPQPTRQEGDTIVIPIHEEIVVVETRLVVREELRLHLRRTRRHETRRETLRTEVVTVERTPGAGAAAEPDERAPGGAPSPTFTTTRGERSS